MGQPDLSVCIVSYRCERALRECLASLRTTRGVNHETIVVDNCSGDGTAEMVAKEFPEVRLFARQDNRGFAFGCNLGMKESRGRQILLLNPDTLVTPDTLADFLLTLRRYPRTGIAGPQLVSETGEAVRCAFRYPTVRLEVQKHGGPLAWLAGGPATGDYEAQAGPVDWVSGACMLVRREAYEDMGPMDDDFFLYYEEVDWQRRMTRAGWRVRFVPDVEVVHVGGACMVNADAGAPVLSTHFVASRRRYFRKHGGWIGAFLVDRLHRVRARFGRGTAFRAHVHKQRNEEAEERREAA